MYIDIVALILIIILVVILNKRFSTFVLTVGALDILLRIIDFIKNNLGLKDLSRFLDKFFPSSFFGIIDKYTDGDINIILKWIFTILMIVFLRYIIKILLKKKKI